VPQAFLWVLSVSYTTEPTTSARTGELFEFVNSIVACVTDPVAQISGSTLRKDLDEYKKDLKTLAP
jgi:hypothetical protein